MTHLYGFGDSNTLGIWDPEGGWFQRVRRHFDERSMASPDFYCVSYNCGVSGDTTVEILERFEPELAARHKDPQEDMVVLFSTCLNDSMYLHERDDSQVPEEKFQENLETLANLAKGHANTVVFLGATKVDQDKVDPIPWHPGGSYRNDIAERYHSIIRRTSEKTGTYRHPELVRARVRTVARPGWRSSECRRSSGSRPPRHQLPRRKRSRQRPLHLA